MKLESIQLVYQLLFKLHLLLRAFLMHFPQKMASCSPWKKASKIMHVHREWNRERNWEGGMSIKNVYYIRAAVALCFGHSSGLLNLHPQLA